MARVDDGLLYLEAEGVAEDQLRRGLSAARQHIARSGVCIEDAMEAAAKWDREIAWEKGEASLAEELSEEDHDKAELVEEAWQIAMRVAGAQMGRLGMLEPARPVVRDLFEIAE